MKFKVVLRDIDDTIIEALKELNKTLDYGLKIISENHPTFIIDTLIKFYKSIGAGGVRVFLGSRKKEHIKLKLISLIADLPDVSKFIKDANRFGLIHGYKEDIFFAYISSVQNDFFNFVNVYRDPSRTFIQLYPIFKQYNQTKNQIANASYSYLSKIVLTKYSGWSNSRRINNEVDHIIFEDDVQNTLFSIEKSMRIFNPKKHKSFFSFCTFRLKEGIKSSSFKIDEEEFVDNLGKTVRAEFIPLAQIDYENEPYEDSSEEDESIDVLSFVCGSFPIPTELRIFKCIKEVDNEME